MSPKKRTTLGQAQRAYGKAYRNWLLHQPKTIVVAAPIGTENDKLVLAGTVTEGPHRSTTVSVRMTPQQVELYNRFNPRAPIACTCG